ncbi:MULTISPECIES: cell wall hydrolase [unclassified Nitratireductor]|uniref:cell wall hydrolase n=1 Tax=unclassified Nitratireductor TaxID=2641084 RepID=UPI000DDDF4BD|nr:cell wall hydrolase [Nitratireductor sp. OM-1]
MLRRTGNVPRKADGESRSLLAPAVVALGFWIGFPGVVAHQDIAGLVSGEESAAPRWAAYLEKSVAGSIHQAEMPFIDGDLKTGSISGSGIAAPGIGAVAFRGKKGFTGTTPDEARINRADKTGRLVQVMPVQPPRLFEAGTIFEKTSFLLEKPKADQKLMAFVKPDIQGEEVRIASAFYMKRDKRADPDMPRAIAALVNNDRADILATAYAPPEPDYAKASPFASILREEEPQGGRFIPPVSAKDHPWARSPLPAEVFSDREQQCLAAGIYFEARGESVEGQAAVAQVILNRVRNPTYPNSICGVVYQNEKWRNRCQFSFACDGIRDRVKSPGHFKTAQDVAMATTAGKIWLPEVGSSTHYHATYVHPRWAGAMQRMKKIGQHIFYRTYGGGWN